MDSQHKGNAGVDPGAGPIVASLRRLEPLGSVIAKSDSICVKLKIEFVKHDKLAQRFASRGY
jgi:hypothetical protein